MVEIEGSGANRERSGKILGFISRTCNFGPNPTAGRPPKGNNRGAIIIMIVPEQGNVGCFSSFVPGSD